MRVKYPVSNRRKNQVLAGPENFAYSNIFYPSFIDVLNFLTRSEFIDAYKKSGSSENARINNSVKYIQYKDFLGDQ
mgnify:CR=1 FL=1